MPEFQEHTEGDSQDSNQALSGLPARYENKGIIAQGGMGVVFRAHDLQLDRDVAIKVLLFEGSRDTELQERFVREARVLGSLDHVNIVKILSWGISEGGNPYQVMEFLEGTTLSSETGSGKRLSLARFREVFPAVLSGLAHAHSRGVVHRDIKPGNIMLCGSQEEFCLKIIDFGIARRQAGGAPGERNLTRTGQLLGSPSYMSPEQCRGSNIDQLSDIYSLACVMYEALTGYPPHQGETAMEVMYKHMMVPAPQLQALASSAAARRLGRLVDRCLARDPQDRPLSVDLIHAELNSIFESRLDPRAFFAHEKAKPGGKVVLLSAAGMVACCALLTWLFVRVVPGVQPADPTGSKRSEIDQAARRLEYSKRVVQDMERSFENAAGDTQRRTELAESLVMKMSDLAQAEVQLAQHRNAESTLQKAMIYARSVVDPGEARASVLLSLGDCKLAEKDARSAENIFLQGLNCLSSSPGSRESQRNRSEIATRLAKQLALLQIQDRRFESAGKTVSLLIKSEYDRSRIDKSFNRPRPVPKMIQDISAVLSKLPLKGTPELVAALNLYDQLAEYMLEKGQEEQHSSGTREMMEKLLVLVQQIPSGTPGYRSLSARTYRLRARYEELNQNMAGALKYRKLADSFQADGRSFETLPDHGCRSAKSSTGK